MPKITNLGANGTLPENAILSYSYSEDATPLRLDTASTGAGQVTSTIETSLDAKGGRLLVNNELSVADDYFGSLIFTARKYSESQDGIGSLTGETIAYKLNAYRAAPPVGGAGADLYEAVLTYCALVDVVPVISSELETKMAAIPVNFIGWTGNVWQYLEMLCQAVSLDTEENTYLEMAVIDNQLHFREALQNNIEIKEFVTSKNFSVDSYDAAQFLTMSYYDTFYGSNRIVQEQNVANNVFAINESVSITDSLQVDAGATITKIVKIKASLESVNQPEVVSQISTLPFPTTGSIGEYVVVGSDDYPIKPEQWTAEGGSLTVRLTDVPDEIEITITAPKSVQMQVADGYPVEVTYAPYKIGVESSGNEYPALYITGTGVFFNKRTVTLPTGASSEYAPSISTSTVDNPFICNKKDLLNRGLATAQGICGPSIAYTANVVSGVEFGQSVGSLFPEYDTKFRINSIAFNQNDATVNASAYVTFADFNEAWAGASIADFNSENENLKFNEFSVIPLVRN